MRTWLKSARSLACRITKFGAIGATLSLLTAAQSFAAQATQEAGGEANLKLPDLLGPSLHFLGIDGHGKSCVLFGILFCIFGLGVRPDHLQSTVRIFRCIARCSTFSDPFTKSVRPTFSRRVSSSCCSGSSIAVVIILYFGVLAPVPGKSIAVTLPIILFFSVVGIAGSYGVAWFGIRVNTFANSRTAFASLRGKPYPIYDTPLQAGMSIGMMLISVELLMMLLILLFVPGDYAGPCFIGFAIGESLGAAALRIAGGIFTKIADIGSDLMEDRL